MEKTIEVLNRLEAEGLIGKYAIGGAIAAACYVEPTVTYDLDVFTVIPGSSLLIDLSPIYSKLKAWGFYEKGGGVEIEGWEVQFLPAPAPLEEAALENAVVRPFSEVTTRVFSAEYLAAIMLQTGRPKDLIRLTQFIDEEALDPAAFIEILTRFTLLDRWSTFLAKHFDGNNPLSET